MTLVGVEVAASGLERLVPISEAIIKAQNQDTEQGLREATALLAEAGIPSRAIERRGQPGPEIVAMAKELRPDLVVVGAHGFGPIMRTVLGSVSTHVLHHWQGATLVVKAGAEPQE